MKASERWPLLRTGLEQMGLEGCQRALELCEREPRRIIATGTIVTACGRY